MSCHPIRPPSRRTSRTTPLSSQFLLVPSSENGPPHLFRLPQKEHLSPLCHSPRQLYPPRSPRHKQAPRGRAPLTPVSRLLLPASPARRGRLAPPPATSKGIAARRAARSVNCGFHPHLQATSPFIVPGGAGVPPATVSILSPLPPLFSLPFALRPQSLGPRPRVPGSRCPSPPEPLLPSPTARPSRARHTANRCNSFMNSSIFIGLAI